MDDQEPKGAGHLVESQFLMLTQGLVLTLVEKWTMSLQSSTGVLPVTSCQEAFSVEPEALHVSSTDKCGRWWVVG